MGAHLHHYCTSESLNMKSIQNYTCTNPSGLKTNTHTKFIHNYDFYAILQKKLQGILKPHILESSQKFTLTWIPMMWLLFTIRLLPIARVTITSRGIWIIGRRRVHVVTMVTRSVINKSMSTLKKTNNSLTWLIDYMAHLHVENWTKTPNKLIRSKLVLAWL